MAGDLHELENSRWTGVGRRLMDEYVPLNVEGLEVALGDWYPGSDKEVKERRRVSSVAIFTYVPELRSILLVDGTKEDGSRRVDIPSGRPEEEDKEVGDVGNREMFEETGIKPSKIWPVVYSVHKEGKMGVQCLAIAHISNSDFVDPDGRVYLKPLDGALPGETTGLILEPLEIFFDRERSLLYKYTEHPWAYNAEVLHHIFNAITKLDSYVQTEGIKQARLKISREYFEYTMNKIREEKGEKVLRNTLIVSLEMLMDYFVRAAAVSDPNSEVEFVLEETNMMLSLAYEKLTGKKLISPFELIELSRQFRSEN